MAPCFFSVGLGRWIGVQEAANPFFLTLVKHQDASGKIDPGYGMLWARYARFTATSWWHPRIFFKCHPRNSGCDLQFQEGFLVLWFHTYLNWLVIASCTINKRKPTTRKKFSKLNHQPAGYCMDDWDILQAGCFLIRHAVFCFTGCYDSRGTPKKKKVMEPPVRNILAQMDSFQKNQT